MIITVAHSFNEFCSIAAWRIAQAIIEKPDAVIGLATGRTTTGIHAALADIYAAHPFDTSRVTVFGMDEITNVSRAFPGSCYDMLLRQVVHQLECYRDSYPAYTGSTLYARRHAERYQNKKEDPTFFFM